MKLSEIDLFQPDVDITPDINLKVRIRVLAQIILELAEGCGATDCEDSIKKGIVERPIIEQVIVYFCDEKKVARGEICFCIDWEKLEFEAKTSNGQTVIERLDLNKLIAPQLDPAVCTELFKFVKRLKEKYNIKETKSSYQYRDKYTKNEDIHTKTRNYMGHVQGKGFERDTKDFDYELKTAFQGLDGYLNIIIRK